MRVHDTSNARQKQRENRIKQRFARFTASKLWGEIGMHKANKSHNKAIFFEHFKIYS